MTYKKWISLLPVHICIYRFTYLVAHITKVLLNLLIAFFYLYINPHRYILRFLIVYHLQQRIVVVDVCIVFWNINYFPYYFMLALFLDGSSTDSSCHGSNDCMLRKLQRWIWVETIEFKGFYAFFRDFCGDCCALEMTLFFRILMPYFLIVFNKQNNVLGCLLIALQDNGHGMCK